MNNYVDKIFKKYREKYCGETEYLNALKEILNSFSYLCSKYDFIEKNNIIERFIEPDRIIEFKVPRIDDNGNYRVNKGYRVQFNNAIGPYKGGLRFHPSVNVSILKFLGLEQCVKNSLTTLQMGGAKGGSDFDPKNKSDNEIMSFCNSFMNELYKYIGPNIDVPAGDIGVGKREIGYLFGQYKRITNKFNGVLTGKSLEFGGSLIRPEATGYGLCYFVAEALKSILSDDFKGKIVTISGAGNVAIYAAEKTAELGGKVVTLSDSDGWIYDENGIDIELVKEIKFNKRERIKKYLEFRKNAKYFDKKSGLSVRSIKSDIALPCATQNELHLEDAIKLVENGVKIVGEGANMPTDLDAIDYLIKHNVIFAPGKAANAGGVAISGLEMSQNAIGLYFERKEMDLKLQNIMKSIYTSIKSTAKEFEVNKYDLLTSANICGLKKIIFAINEQGL